ncbi:peptidyl-dipeptidase Dcp [Maribellus maritimus]|uniref:peptidyl-dipeptidase Dcp n=1 Tax=Maribellus maritimus TaxID=2870838 RepID=UPI001EECB9A9|nr:peptidyl-dipeptidase Dcp [Maribellus maritimus]MCG6186484.1 peptidyl-dipeptidase Dcp [Maribellus maritimus]
MKKLSIVAMGLLVLILASCNQTTKKKESMGKTENPFMKVSTLPFQAPDFTKIKNSHFAPALEEGIKQQLAEIEQIADNPEEPTFENTLVALEKSGKLLTRTLNVFEMLSGANTNDTLQDLQEEIAPKLAGLQDAITLNDNLFNRIKTIYQKKNELDLDKESTRLLQYYYDEFTRAGANLPAEAKEKLKKLNEEDALLSAKFTNQLLSGTKAGALVVDNDAELKGLSESQIKQAAKNAADAGKEGKYLISLQNTTQQPLLQSLENRETRQKLFEASWARTEKEDKNDTRDVIQRLAEIRAEKAALLGFSNFAAWTLQDQMAKTPQAVESFLGKLIPPATANARKEAKDLQALIDRDKGGFKLQPYDWNMYAEQLRKERFDLDEDQIKPYFELFNVLENGVFYATSRLYGLSFERRTDIPIYNPDMRVYEVKDADGSELALFYCDYFQRDNKSGGAWMSNVVGQSKLLGTKPVVYNVCNFTKPAEGEPTLISYDDVTTMFHEFGHALHGIFADQTYPSLSGTNVARDFVELPSQFNEHWALYPDVFKNYAKHYKTGAPMPEELVSKIKKSVTFNQGYALTEILAASELDMEWHTIKAGTDINSADKFESEALAKNKLDIPQVPPRYRSSYFLHIWSNGYSAGYYAYLWAEMLDQDAFAWFEENGGLSFENGQRFRKLILSRGNTEDYNEMYFNFAGREPNINPMLKNRGIAVP